MPNPRHIILVDGYGFVFRAYHSLPPLSRPDGTPVGAVYGFTNMLLKLIESHEYSHIAVVLDAGSKTFRNEIYSEYKANRPPAPEDLVPQFPLIRQAVEALNIPAIEQKGYEADDIIATFAHMAKEQGDRLTIISSDKDLMQLIGGTVSMYDPLKSKVIAAEQVVEKFGVGPEQLLDVLSLMGDSADNVPGVPGIGPKIAAELIQHYGSLEVLLQRTEEVKQQKRRENLEAFKDQAILSKKLIQLEEHVPLTTSLDDLAARELNDDVFIAFAKEQGFKRFVARMQQEPEQSREAKQISFVKEHNPERVKQFFADADKEVTHFIACIQEKKQEYGVLVVEGKGLLIPFELQQQKALFEEEQPVITRADFAEMVKPLLADASIHKVTYDLKTLMGYIGLSFDDVAHVDDLLLMSYMAHAGVHDQSVEHIAAYYQELSSISVHCEGEAPLLLTHIGAISHLYPLLQEQLYKQRLLWLYYRLEKPLQPVLYAMEQQGITVSAKRLADLSQRFDQSMKALEQPIYDAAGEVFNIASPKQLGEILFGKLGLEGGKKSKKTGAYSTNAEILNELAEDGHAIARYVVEWRTLAKLKNTYSDALPQQIASDGRVHTHFMQAATSTGRLSSRDPNLQNIPIRTEEGHKIREAFIAAKGHKLISADYSQIELRLLADMADIEPLKEAFGQGHDIHSATASAMFAVPLEKVDSELRRRAKMINFGIIYGISAFGLASRLGIERSEAKAFIDQYFEQYPGIRRYMDASIARAKERGYVETFFGRRCHINNINNRNPALRQFSERAAINAPLQGTAADIIKQAMLDLASDASLKAWNVTMLLQVHDELIFEVPEHHAQEASKRIKQIMESAASLSVPLTVETGVGDHWAEIH